MSKINTLALAILAIMAILLFGSVWNDSATMDELAHIPAGFGYIQGDARLNPEHPPLIKMLSAFSARLAANPYFPTNTRAWSEDVNGQWDQGSVFLYESGNNADRIIFWARFPLMLLTLIFGWLIFSWTKKRFGNTTAFLTLLFFAFSPTILAHSRYVTTDLGAAFGFFVGIAAFLRFLEIPSWRNVLWAAVALGAALLLKFSTVLLIPLFIFLIVVWTATRTHLKQPGEYFRFFGRTLWKTIIIGIVALALIWITYGAILINYPAERQFSDAQSILSSYRVRPAADLNLKLIQNSFTRPIGQYLLGFLMVGQRAAGGNTAFFLGEVSNVGSRTYFPLLYLLKEPLALHVLTIIALAFAIWKIRRAEKTKTFWARLKFWIYDNFAEFSAWSMILLYWAVSIKSPLNIGVRHILPTLPFVYLLVSRQLGEWIKLQEFSEAKNWLEFLKIIYRVYLKPIPKILLVFLLLFWLILDTLLVFPGFLSYYNELAGGPKKGFLIATDSNYDWGQDLKRLADYTNRHNIEKIALDYFGGGNPKYYLGEKFEQWRSSFGPARGWFAISATFRQETFGAPGAGFTRKPEDSYLWLRPYVPAAQIGYSIFLYKLP